MQRGKPSTLVLSRLNPSLTVPRAPGPGPITKDPAWKEVASQSQSDLPHRLGESLQAQIAECGPWLGSPPKKRVKQNGKWQWTKPSFVKMKTRKLPGGKRLKVKCGTQHIDRCWKFIKERMAKGAHVQAGSMTLNRNIRSAHYEYWHLREQHAGASLFLHVRNHRLSFVSHQKKIRLVCSCRCFCLLPSMHLT